MNKIHKSECLGLISEIIKLNPHAPGDTIVLIEGGRFYIGTPETYQKRIKSEKTSEPFDLSEALRRIDERLANLEAEACTEVPTEPCPTRPAAVTSYPVKIAQLEVNIRSAHPEVEIELMTNYPRGIDSFDEVASWASLYLEWKDSEALSSHVVNFECTELAICALTGKKLDPEDLTYLRDNNLISNQTLVDLAEKYWRTACPVMQLELTAALSDCLNRGD